MLGHAIRGLQFNVSNELAAVGVVRECNKADLYLDITPASTDPLRLDMRGTKETQHRWIISINMGK